MSIETVRTYFATYHIEDRIREFTSYSATVELAAAALGCEPARIAKTLSFDAAGQAILIVAAGDAHVDNHKFKEQFHTKAKMLKTDEVEARIGHAVGGVCPFAVLPGIPVWLDISLKRFTTVFPACGSASSAIELTLPELEKYARSSGWIDVCKNWQEK